MATKKGFWISYDLGIKGDYTGLYTWLDSLKAIECGNSIAFFKKELSVDIIESMQKELTEKVKLEKTDRVYLIYLDKQSFKIKGKFLFGGRKKAPWEGYAEGTQDSEEIAE